MMFNLVGGLAGTAGTSNNVYKRVQGVDITSNAAANNGGLRVIENVGYANRVTTTADRDAIREVLIRNVFPTSGAAISTGRPMSYPADVSGNGGGGKVKF